MHPAFTPSSAHAQTQSTASTTITISSSPSSSSPSSPDDLQSVPSRGEGPSSNDDIAASIMAMRASNPLTSTSSEGVGVSPSSSSSTSSSSKKKTPSSSSAADGQDGATDKDDKEFGEFGRHKACTACRTAHAACDSRLPSCTRCVSMGLADQCVYLAARKRGRPSNREKSRNLSALISQSKRHADFKVALLTQSKGSPIIMPPHNAPAAPGAQLPQLHQQGPPQQPPPSTNVQAEKRQRTGDYPAPPPTMPSALFAASAQAMASSPSPIPHMNLGDLTQAALRAGVRPPGRTVRTPSPENVNPPELPSPVTSAYVPPSPYMEPLAQPVPQSPAVDVNRTAQPEAMGSVLASILSELKSMKEDQKALNAKVDKIMQEPPAPTPATPVSSYPGPQSPFSVNSAAWGMPATPPELAVNNSMLPSMANFRSTVFPSSPPSTTSLTTSPPTTSTSPPTPSTPPYVIGQSSALIRPQSPMQPQIAFGEEFSGEESSLYEADIASLFAPRLEPLMPNKIPYTLHASLSTLNPFTSLGTHSLNSFGAGCLPPGTVSPQLLSNKSLLFPPREIPRPGYATYTEIPPALLHVVLGKISFADLHTFFPAIPAFNPSDNGFLITDVRKPFIILEKTTTSLPSSSSSSTVSSDEKNGSGSGSSGGSGEALQWKPYHLPPGWEISIIAANTSFCKLFRYAYQEIVGASILSLFTKLTEFEMYPLVYCPCPYPASNIIPVDTVHCITKDSQEFVASTKLQAFYDEKGDFAWGAMSFEVKQPPASQE